VNNKTCYVCGKENLEKNELGLNQKLFGRKVVRFYCYGCLAEYLEIETEELMAKIEGFRLQGCLLFE
jgi:hypothetical protein